MSRQSPRSARSTRILILIGLQLRDVSGLEAVGWLKADPAFCLVPVVALSAGALPADDPMLRRSGVGAV